MEKNKALFTREQKDLVVLGVVFFLALVLSYYFNVFIFIVDFLLKHPSAISYVDEVIVGLLILSIGFAVISWRRLNDCKNESERCIIAEREIAKTADTRAETERIIAKQLHAEIEVLMKYLREDREILLSKIPKAGPNK
jgi:hypothetical protein